MKTLITQNEIKKAMAEGKTQIFLDEDALVTAAARDMALERNIEIIKGDAPAAPAVVAAAAPAEVCCEGAVDADLVSRIVNQVIAALPQACAPNEMIKIMDPSGLGLIRGNSVVCEPFNTGDPKDKVGIKEIFTIEESPNMATGFMTMEDATSFDFTLQYDELDYIVEGTLEFTVDGRKYTANEGDVFFVPMGTSVTFSTPDKVRFFFVTYPANWAELVGYEG